MSRNRLRFLAASVALVAAPSLFAAQAASHWPSSPIRIIVGYPAGGVSDVVARALAQDLSDSLKTSVIIENRAGAGGNIGMQAVAQATPDGYTLGFAATSPLALNPFLVKTPYNPNTDFAPIASVMFSPILLVATHRTPISTVSQLVEASRAAPGSLSWATSGKGSVGSLMIAQISDKAGIKVTEVPYKGAGQQMQDAIGGQFDFMSINTSAAVDAQIKQGTLKPLAVGAPKRLAAYPNVPTFAEVGFQAANMTSTFGLWAPAHTPVAVITRLNAAVNQALKDPKIQQLLVSTSNVPTGGTPEAFAKEIQIEATNNARIIKEAHIAFQP